MKELIMNSALPLYVLVIMLAVVVAFASYQKGESIAFEDGKRQIVKKPMVNLVGFSVSFIILWALLAFATCGADYETYNMLFLNAHDWSFCVTEHQIEKGWAVLNAILRIFTADLFTYNSILAFIFLTLVFTTFYRLRDKIHFGWGVLAFTCIFYLQYMNLKRIYIASAICFAAIPWLLNKKYIYYALTVVLTSFLHTSAIVMLLPLLIVLTIAKKVNYKVLGLLALLGMLCIYIFRNILVNISISTRYEEYGLLDVPIGPIIALYHVPIIWLLLRYGEPREEGDRSVAFVWLLCSFAISSMGYFMALVGRMFVYFMFPFAFVPSIDNCYVGCEERLLNANKRKKQLINLIFVGYFICRLIVYSMGMGSDGIMHYTNIFAVNF